jgi:hypothetical protein
VNRCGRPPGAPALARRFSVAAAFCLAMLAQAAPSRATLAEDVSRLKETWQRQARVEQLRPRLSSRGETLPLALPAWATDERSERCTSVTLLANPRVSFVLQVANGPGLDVRSSEVGAMQLSRCGSHRVDLRRTLLEMRSPRGIIEVLVAEAPVPLAPLSSVLAHRDPGPKSPGGQAGPAAGSRPAAPRAARERLGGSGQT